MAKPRLSDKAVKNAKGKKYLADGGGLYLQISPTGSKSWVFRWWDRTGANPGERGKLREMGLGGYPVTTLAQARTKAETALKIADAGGDPIKAREAIEAQVQTEVLKEFGQSAPGAMTFDKCAAQYITEMLEPVCKTGAKTVPQWRASLKEYASPHIGAMDVAEISTDDMKRVLDPIWYAINETAARVRSRCENILDWCAVMGYRERDRINPAAWRGNLQHLFQPKKKVSPVQHFAALPYSAMPALYAELAAKDSLTAKALRFTMLTACRTGEVIRAEWSEIENGVWTVAAHKMKAGKEHAVPLSTEAGGILNLLDDSGRYLFPAGNKGKRGHGHMSNIAQLKLLQEMRPGTTVHGFRSAFRDWVAEETDCPNHVAEMALAHIVRGVEGAYRRGAMLEKRAALMEDWANFLTDTHCS